jgi:hypothetical protein
VVVPESQSSVAARIREASRDFVRYHLSRHPVLFRTAYLVARQRLDVLVGPNTDLLIEGYPRSANTFAVLAFRTANPGTRTANHLHNPAHVMLATRYGVPAVVLLRRPSQAIPSLLVRRPDLPAARAIRNYVEFYELLEPYLDRIVVASFETVIGDFAAVIAAVNERFATGFRLYSSQLHRDTVMAEIDQANAYARGGRVAPEAVPRPHPVRERLKNEQRLDGYASALLEAERVYERLRKAAL